MVAIRYETLEHVHIYFITHIHASHTLLGSELERASARPTQQVHVRISHAWTTRLLKSASGPAHTRARARPLLNTRPDTHNMSVMGEHVSERLMGHHREHGKTHYRLNAHVCAHETETHTKRHQHKYPPCGGGGASGGKSGAVTSRVEPALPS